MSNLELIPIGRSENFTLISRKGQYHLANKRLLDRSSTLKGKFLKSKLRLEKRTFQRSMYSSHPFLKFLYATPVNTFPNNIGNFSVSQIPSIAISWFPSTSLTGSRLQNHPKLWTNYTIGIGNDARYFNH